MAGSNEPGAGGLQGVGIGIQIGQFCFVHAQTHGRGVGAGVTEAAFTYGPTVLAPAGITPIPFNTC